MNKYETIINSKTQYNLLLNNPQTNYKQKYYQNQEITKNINALETNIYKHYNNASLNYYEIKNIIRNEFSELIIPYQKQLNNYDNIIDQKLNIVESNLKGIIDSKSFDNINQTAQMITMVLKNPNYANNENKNILQNNNENKNNLEDKLNLMVKNEYAHKFEVMERQINSMNSLLKTLKETFDSNMLDIFKNEEYKKSYTEKSEYEKYKSEINLEIKMIKEEQKKIRTLNTQVQNLFENVNDLTIESNDNQNKFSNEINLLKNRYNNIEKIIFELENKINNSQLDKLNHLNIDNLKNINIYEINEMKQKIKIINDNSDDLYEKFKNNDKNMNNLANKFNNLEQNFNYINKDIEFLNKQNLNDKFEELKKKLEEYNIKNKNITNKIENIDKIIHDEEYNNHNIHESNNNEIENNELKNENIFEIKGSRRQKRNLTKSEIKPKINTNLNLDENTTKILKQIENINLDNINKKLDYLTSENKMILSKIETNNDNFMNINEQENILNQKLEELNKKIKESENRLYLLELKNFGNTKDNNNEDNKEDKSPFSINKNNKEDSKIYEINKISNENIIRNIYNNDNSNNGSLNKKNEEDLIENIMKDENNTYKGKNSFGLNKEDKSYKDISISNLIKPILDEDDTKNRKSNENNSKIKEEQINNKNNDINSYDDFDDI